MPLSLGTRRNADYSASKNIEGHLNLETGILGYWLYCVFYHKFKKKKKEKEEKIFGGLVAKKVRN